MNTKDRNSARTDEKVTN